MTTIVEDRLPLPTSREPGMYDGIPIEEYHADRTTLSGAKLLLPPSCPAKFRYLQDHPEPPTAAMEFGTAVHAVVLGDGPEIVVCDYASWKSGAAQDDKALAHAEGKIPLLPKEKAQIDGMAASVRSHPIAGPMFSSGVAEQSLYWQHAETGVTCRARPDWITRTTDGRTVIVDLKSAAAADLESLQKALWNFGYYLQAGWYRAGVRVVLGVESPEFVFVFVEKTPPYIVTLVRPDRDALKIGAIQRATALHIYRQCVDEDRWPAYADDVEPLALPQWVERQFI
jgi:hypothetical protein